MPELHCKITHIDDLTASVKRVMLAPEKPLTFSAGQYIQVVMGEKDRRPFSIANAQREDDLIELHIGANPGNDYALQVLEKFDTGETIIEGPLGEASLKQDSTLPIILLAGGTGYSYIRSILHKLIEKPLTEDVYLYWGAKTKADLYEFDELMALCQENAKIHFEPVVQEPDSNWVGKSGLVHQAVMHDHSDLSPFSVYVAGRFEMAAVARDDFTQQGLLPENLFGDAYAFI
jgi:aquacobalamin reductase/NAD(P)H-flavin reductase